MVLVRRECERSRQVRVGGRGGSGCDGDDGSEGAWADVGVGRQLGPGMRLALREKEKQGELA